MDVSSLAFDAEMPYGADGPLGALHASSHIVLYVIMLLPHMYDSALRTQFRIYPRLFGTESFQKLGTQLDHGVKMAEGMTRD